MSTTEATNVATIANLTKNFGNGFASRLFFFDASIATADGWIELRKNRAFRRPDGITSWAAFGLRPTPPLHDTRLAIVVIPPAWSDLVLKAVSAAIDDYDRKTAS